MHEEKKVGKLKKRSSEVEWRKTSKKGEPTANKKMNDHICNQEKIEPSSSERVIKYIVLHIVPSSAFRTKIQICKFVKAI